MDKSTSVVVRQAQRSDAEAIAGIWNGYIRDTTVTFTTALKDVQVLARDIESRGPAFQVAQGAEGVLGFATYFPFRAGPGYAHTKEHSIMLSPAARGTGAGRLLMTRLEAAGRAEGVHSLFAGVSGDNPEAVTFHAKIGFRHVARLPEVGFKFGRWLDLVLMQKLL